MQDLVNTHGDDLAWPSWLDFRWLEFHEIGEEWFGAFKEPQEKEYCSGTKYNKLQRQGVKKERIEDKLNFEGVKG